MTSKQYRLIKKDLQRWGKNVLIFTAPALAAFFFSKSQGLTTEQSIALALPILWGLFYDLFKKFKTETVYRAKK